MSKKFTSDADRTLDQPTDSGHTVSSPPPTAEHSSCPATNESGMSVYHSPDIERILNEASRNFEESINGPVLPVLAQTKYMQKGALKLLQMTIEDNSARDTGSYTRSIHVKYASLSGSRPEDTKYPTRGQWVALREEELRKLKVDRGPLRLLEIEFSKIAKSIDFTDDILLDNYENYRTLGGIDSVKDTAVLAETGRVHRYNRFVQAEAKKG